MNLEQALKWVDGIDTKKPVGQRSWQAAIVLAEAVRGSLHMKCQERTDVPCKDNPDAPHGFVRNASHSEGRYVCECEQWQPIDPVVETVRERLKQRSEVGLKKYGTGMDRTDLTRKQWLNHALEEAMDLALYLQRLIDMEETGK